MDGLQVFDATAKPSPFDIALSNRYANGQLLVAEPRRGVSSAFNERGGREPLRVRRIPVCADTPILK